jgi:Fe2+ or Zn2+ uptake regulation protein
MGGDRENETANDTENLTPLAMRETALVRRLRAARLRPTLARIKALEMFSENPGLQDADSVFRWLAGQGAPACLATIYRSLRCLHKAGFLLCIRDLEHGTRYRLPPEPLPRLRLVCRDGEGKGRASFSDPALYAQLFAIAAKEGLFLEGREFELQVCFEQGAGSVRPARAGG